MDKQRTSSCATLAHCSDGDLYTRLLIFLLLRLTLYRLLFPMATTAVLDVCGVIRTKKQSLFFAVHIQV